MANLKFKSSKSQWESLSVVRGPKGDNANITLNGSNATNASFYVPISSGLSGQILQSKGANENPVWVEHQMPTVNNAVLDIKKNGTSLGTFSANSNTNQTIDIEVPTSSEIQTLIQNAILASHPIGSIEVNVTGVNPSTYIGGNWTLWGSGRVPVGIDPTQTEFNTVEKTGGEKTHILTIDEMPKHTHAITITSGGAHQHNVATFPYSGTNKEYYCISQTPGGDVNKDITWRGGIAQESGEHTHSASAAENGKSQAHNNLQPYITCYMWKRSADNWNYNCSITILSNSYTIDVYEDSNLSAKITELTSGTLEIKLPQKIYLKPRGTFMAITISEGSGYSWDGSTNCLTFNNEISTFNINAYSTHP